MQQKPQQQRLAMLAPSPLTLQVQSPTMAQPPPSYLQQSSTPQHIQGSPRVGGNVTPRAFMGANVSGDSGMNVGSTTAPPLRVQGKAPMPFPPQKMLMKVPVPNPTAKVGPPGPSIGNPGMGYFNVPMMENFIGGGTSTLSPRAMHAAVAASPTGAFPGRTVGVDPSTPVRQRTGSVASVMNASDDSGSRYLSRGGMESAPSLVSTLGSQRMSTPPQNSKQAQQLSVLPMPQHQYLHHHRHHHPQQYQQQPNSIPGNRTNQPSPLQSRHLGGPQVLQPQYRHHHHHHQMQRRASINHLPEVSQPKKNSVTMAQGSAAATTQNNNNSNNTDPGSSALAPEPPEGSTTVAPPAASVSVASSSDILVVSPNVHLRDEVGEAGIAPSSVIPTSEEGEKSQQSKQKPRVLMFPSLTIVDSDEDSSGVSANNVPLEPQQEQGNQMGEHKVEEGREQEVPRMVNKGDTPLSGTPERQTSLISTSSLDAPSAPTSANATQEGEGDAGGGTESTRLLPTSEHRAHTSSGVPPQTSSADVRNDTSTVPKPEVVVNENVKVVREKKKKKIPQGPSSSLIPSKTSYIESANAQSSDEKKAERILSSSPRVRKGNGVPLNHEKDDAGDMGRLRRKQEDQQSQRRHSVLSSTSSEASVESLESREKRRKRIRRGKSRDNRMNSLVSPSPRRNSTDRKSSVKVEKKKKKESVPLGDKKVNRNRSTGDDDNVGDRRHSSPSSLSHSLFHTRDVYELYRKLKRQQESGQRDRFLRWHQHGPSSPVDSRPSPNKSSKKLTHGHKQSPQPWRHTSLHTPPMRPVTPLRRPLGYIGLGKASYSLHSRWREVDESGSLTRQSSLKSGSQDLFRSPLISPISTQHTIYSGTRGRPLHSQRHVIIPQAQRQKQRGESTTHPYELVSLQQQHKHVESYDVDGSPNGNHHRRHVGGHTLMRCESAPVRGVSPIRKVSPVRSHEDVTQSYYEGGREGNGVTLRSSQHTSRGMRFAPVTQRRHPRGAQKGQAEVEIPSPVFTTTRSSPRQSINRHRTDPSFRRRRSEDAGLSGHAYPSSYSSYSNPSHTTAMNAALETVVPLSSSLPEGVLSRGNINGSGASAHNEPILIPVVDLRTEFKPQLETTQSSRESITPSKASHGNGVKNTTPSRLRSNNYAQTPSAGSVTGSRHCSPQRSARRGGRSPTRYVDIPQGKLFSSFDVREPERPSAWAMGPERGDLIPNSPKTRRRIVRKIASYTAHAADVNNVNTDDDVAPVLLVEELRLDEQRRPYLLIREVPYGPAAVSAQRDSVERLSRPRPNFVRRGNGIHEASETEAYEDYEQVAVHKAVESSRTGARRGNKGEHKKMTSTGVRRSQ